MAVQKIWDGSQWIQVGVSPSEHESDINSVNTQLVQTVKTSDTGNWQKTKITKDDGQALDLGADINPDTIINSGFYRFALNSAMYGLQAGTYSLIVSRAISSNITQVLIGTNANIHNQMFLRSSNNATWTEWSEVYNSYRHSVIESTGSNANGQWIRFSDGTQICTHRINASATANTAGSTIWTFPVSFVADTMRHSVNVSNNTNTWGFDIALLAMSANTHNISANVRYKFSITQVYVIDLFVIGRWK